MSEKEQLQAIREQIDDIDQQLQALINERANCAKRVAEIKIQSGETEHFYRPEREAQILRTIEARNQGPLDGQAMARLFREIMSACLALERPLRIAYLGPAGTYNHGAALKHFGAFIEEVAVDNIEDIFRSVETGQAHFGVAPIENSTEGVITHTLDLLINSSLQICGEVDLPINHNLISHETDLKKINKLYCHAQSLAQCRQWLDHNLPGVEKFAVRSNSQGVILAARDKHSAAIAGSMAAEIYEVPVQVADIQDEADNTTRFIVIGRHPVPASGRDRTSILVTTTNKPGALYKLLKPIADRNLGMSKIESRPSRRGVWEYVFFIDIEGHKDDPEVSAALADIEHESAMIRILGSFPIDVLK